MINTMDCAADAQSLISISLRKIHNSRTQRGGIKLHKNLLVSYVLRNARQVYMNERYAELYRTQRYREVMTICSGIQELNPADLRREDENGCCGGEPASPCGPPPPACQLSAAHAPAAGGACFSTLVLQEGCMETEPSYYRSCCAEACPMSNCDLSPANSSTSMHCNKTTVLDLDTHIVTTVDNGYLHQDCCAPLQCCQGAQSPAKKRKVEFGSSVSDVLEEVPDFVPGWKRAKTEDCLYPYAEYIDTSNISNLISIFGSGFSGLVSRQADQICSKQALASLGAWTRAIVAF